VINTNKLLSIAVSIFLLIFSFFYTDKIINILKDKDPLMSEIKNNSSKFKVEADDALIVSNNIISGSLGLEVDLEESYNKMKRYGTYNESLISLKEVAPTISIEDNYDKYIIRGNKNKRSIALIFLVNSSDNIDKVIKILKNKEVDATFFIDEDLVTNEELINKLNSFEVELLNNNSNEAVFKTSISYLNNITNKSSGYCYSEKDDDKLLKLCSKLKLHTIKPTISISENLLNEIKVNLANSLIIKLDINKKVENQLYTTITYIKSKGYTLETIDNLVSE
jgi:hypothetical protein